MGYGDPGIDKKLKELVKDALKLEENGDYAEAISKVDEEIASLDAFEISSNDNHLKTIFKSTLRDRKLFKRILEMKIEEEKLSSRIYKLENKMKEFEEKNDPRKFT